MKRPAGVCGVDIETSSASPLKDVGAWAYSMHESTIVLCVVFCISTENPRSKVKALNADVGAAYDYIHWEPGQPFPRKVAAWIKAGGDLLAHNHGFEDAIWKNVLEPLRLLDRTVVPRIPRALWQDTQPLGRAMNGPASLDGLGAMLGCDVQKDQEGKSLMLKMCKAAKDEWGYHYPLAGDRVARDRLARYCALDVGAMLDAYWKLRALSDMEARVLVADKKINERGVYLNRTFAFQCARIAQERKAELDSEAFLSTEFELENSRSEGALKAWLKALGVSIPRVTRTKKLEDGTVETTRSESVDKNSVRKLLDDDDLPEVARVVLENRQESNQVSSASKFGKVPQMVGATGRLYNALAYCGAHTGRWTSYGLQLHNWAKDKMKPGESALVRSAIAAGLLWVLKWADVQPLSAISQSARSIIAAPEGRELIAADWSAIEARVLAWLSGQADVLRLFRRGIDVYVHAADEVGSDPDEVGKEDHRALGKVCVLALGYGMGALLFWSRLAEAGIHVTLKEARRIQQAWRKSNGKTVDFWYELEDACRDAITNKGVVFPVGKFIEVVCSKACLLIRLPSGRCLRYWKPRIVKSSKTIRTVNEEGEVVAKKMTTQEIRFHAPTGGGMKTESTYSGKLAENVTQAVARDLLAWCLVRIDEDYPDYEVVMHVHDSVAAEVDTGGGSVAEFCAIMEELPAWADGLPMKAEGYRDTRFRG